MELILWDSLEILKTMKDNSVDSIVCDPPYWISFMWKKWDYDVPQKEVRAECLRVLKPWWHALVACWTRTQHRMAVNLEDWGFEIRDIIARMYGSWMPKSLDIGKAVDKLQGNERETVWERVTGSAMASRKLWRWSSDAWSGTNIVIDTKWTSPYEGRGTNLKPAMELRTLYRKPLDENTIAKNVLKHGTGGINIDECRVEWEMGKDRALGKPRRDDNDKYGKANSTINPQNPKWRFPSNFIHDWSDEVVDLFPNSKSTTGKRGGQGFHNSLGRADKKRKDWQIISGHSDSWSAARYFYCAKASSSERKKWAEWQCTHPTIKPVKLMQYLCRLITPVWWTILDPYMWSGSTGIWAKLWGFDFIGIEREEEYVELAKARIQARENNLS